MAELRHDPDIYDTLEALLALDMRVDRALVERSGNIGARYGEWVDAFGAPRARFLRRPEFLACQVELVRALYGTIAANDTVIIALPYELTFAGHVAERALELIGATLIGVGTSNTICPMPRTLGLMRRYGASSLVTSSSRALELARLVSLQGASTAPPTLHSLVLMGQVCAPQRRDKIAALWGARPLQVFGTPAVPVVATPCPAGELHLCEEWLSADVSRPEPARLTEGRAVRGELVLQAACRSVDDTPIATGELVELWPRERRCACGDERRVVVPVGQIAEAVETATGLVSTGDVERVLFDSLDLDPEMTITARRDGFRVRCTPRRDEGASWAEFARWGVERLRVGLGVDSDLERVVLENTGAKPTTRGEVINEGGAP